ncbi:MAG: hypothetical protein NDF54_10680 [archaeon GB-1867-035]|nr:hypothetical protein [Candidatus Culexmicrobium profundum]
MKKYIIYAFLLLITFISITNFQYVYAYTAGDDDPDPVRDHCKDEKWGLCFNPFQIWSVYAEIWAYETKPEEYTSGHGEGEADGCWGIWPDYIYATQVVITKSYAWCKKKAHFSSAWGDDWWATAYAYTSVSYD